MSWLECTYDWLNYHNRPTSRSLAILKLQYNITKLGRHVEIRRIRQSWTPRHILTHWRRAGLSRLEFIDAVKVGTIQVIWGRVSAILFQRAVVRTIQKWEWKRHSCFPSLRWRINGHIVVNAAASTVEIRADHSSTIQIWVINSRIKHYIWRWNVKFIITLGLWLHIRCNEKFCHIWIENRVIAWIVTCWSCVFLFKSGVGNVQICHIRIRIVIKTHWYLWMWHRTSQSIRKFVDSDCRLFSGGIASWDFNTG